MQLRQSIFMQLIPRCHLRRSYFHATPFHFRPILLHNFDPQQFLHIIHSVVYDTQACGCVNYSVGYDVFNMLTFIVMQRPLGVCLVCTLSPISATLCVSSVHWTSHMCYLGSNATKCWWWTPSDPKSYGCQRAAVVAVVGVQEPRTVSRVCPRLARDGHFSATVQAQYHKCFYFPLILAGYFWNMKMWSVCQRPSLSTIF